VSPLVRKVIKSRLIKPQEVEIENHRKPSNLKRSFSPDLRKSKSLKKSKMLSYPYWTDTMFAFFAYGQTGSGKTYTMEGPKADPGINTRTLKKLFEEIEAVRDRIDYKLEITLLEIYNDQVRDLLERHETPLRIVGMEVPDLKRFEVKNEDEVMTWMRVGAKNRATATTNMNEHSSRSHLILSIYVTGRNRVDSKQVQISKLHLIDLAGSERVAKSGVEGDRLKEAQAINSSLSVLGNCIAARAAKQNHVPYRDSSLTLLLRDSLEKNSKTLMFCQISPEESSSGESICTLKFATRAKDVELGKAEKNVKALAAPAKQ